MKSEIEEISPVKKKITVEIDSGDVNKRLKDAYKALGKSAAIPGFRKGKVPKRILEQHYGRRIEEDVIKNLINETLPKAVEEAEAFPLTMPVIENETLKHGEVFRYSAIMEVKPEFDLKDYMGIEVEKEICIINDDDLNEQLEELRKARGKLLSIEEDRGIREDDYVVIEYEGFEGDDPIDGVKSDNFMLRIGKNDFHPDVESALIGLKKDDKTEVNVDFEGEHFNNKLAGKTVIFKVKVIDLKTMELPELDEEFVKGLGLDLEKVDDLKEKIREDVTKREETRIENDLKRRLLEKVSDIVEFELPESLVKSEIEQAVNSIKQNLIRSGSSLENAGLREEKLREEFRPASEKRVKEMLVLAEIAKQNELSVSESDITDGFNDAAEKMGQQSEVIRKYYEANQLMETFRNQLLQEKTLNYLVGGAKVIEVERDKLKTKKD